MLDAGFPAIPAHLVTTERHCRVHRLIAIDPYRSRADRLGELVRLADVARPHPAAEAEVGCVGALHQFVRVLERDRGDHRSEDFLLRDAHLVADIGEDGRRHEVALAEIALGEALAADHSRRAFLLTDVEIASDTAELLLRHQRPDLDVRVDAIADFQALAEFGDLADEFVIDALLDKQPRAGAADLSGIGEHRHCRARHRRIDIRIGEHDIRRFAAEFERDALEVAGRRPDDGLSRKMRARERHLVDVGMGRQRRAGGFAIARHHVDHAWRYAGFQRQFA